MVMGLWKFNGSKCLRKPFNGLAKESGMDPSPFLQNEGWLRSARHKEDHFEAHLGCQVLTPRWPLHPSLSSVLTQSKIISNSEKVPRKWPVALNSLIETHTFSISFPIFHKMFKLLENIEPKCYSLKTYRDIWGVRSYSLPPIMLAKFQPLFRRTIFPERRISLIVPAGHKNTPTPGPGGSSQP